MRWLCGTDTLVCASATRESSHHAAIQIRDPEGQWLHVDRREVRCAVHHRYELIAARKPRGGRFEILVGTALAGDGAAEAREEVAAVGVVECRGQPVRWLAELEHDDASSGTNHARHLGDAFGGIA